jgi:hypothetical protein
LYMLLAVTTRPSGRGESPPAVSKVLTDRLSYPLAERGQP